MSTPVPGGAPGVPNAPGRPALSYRITTHGDTLARSLAEVSRRLPGLTTHSTDDPAVALLDAWASVADIVAFYQERIANEGFLRTATERVSVRELARSVGYELRPGAAASAYLSFTVEDAPGAPGSAVVPAGTPVQSVPGQGELPQTFETGAELLAVAEHNAIRLRLRRPQLVGLGTTRLHLAGTTTGLRPGDALLIRFAKGPHTWQFRILHTVEPLPADPTGRPPTTVVGWDQGLNMPSSKPVEVHVHALRLRASIFGHNAPDWRTMPVQVRESYLAAAGRRDTAAFDQDHFDETHFDLGEQWPGFALTDPPEGADGPVIELDAAHPALLPGSWLVLRAPGVQDELYKIVEADQSAAADFTLTSTTTRLQLRGTGKVSPFDRRATVVHTQSEQLQLADEPDTTLVTGPGLWLERPVTLKPGAPVVVTGTTDQGVPSTAVHLIDTVAEDGTMIVLDRPLEHPLDPASVLLLGNVVAATAGQTTEEVLGSGDGRATHQRFTLLHKDLTHVSAPTASGVRDTLAVQVDGVTWTEASSLFPLGPHDRTYVVRIQDDATATVVFGDGERGARLPSGQENVRATYRTGIGPQGNVGAGSLSLLVKRPLGVRAVDNPLAASGGTAPERPDDVRTRAPLTVRTFDRVVSLDDHEAFARNFTGIAKARATVLRPAPMPFLHLTVAAPDGAVSHDTLTALRAALETDGLPGRRLGLGSYLELPFTLAVAILPAPDRDPDTVSSAVEHALAQLYAFERRDFAQPVTAAEAIATAQRVPGVVAANLTQLRLTDGSVAGTPLLPARGAHFDAAGTAVPAELLVLKELTVEVMTS
ncbi:putative baseplate assembly protein [Streptomyces torulosus]|uniref:putative baseplate assembly protein n=1 Tax=Streptomyces torulosus TaxID=68276 RepID=UPI00099EA0DB|nr:putative baseplate assembly protein [Streptomyces torulosus]